jgi:ABC-type uncharacterized transport system ATPase subunit
MKILYRQAKLLILDEPTAVLTPDEVEGFFEMLRALKRQGHSVIIITHKLAEVAKLQTASRCFARERSFRPLNAAKSISMRWRP